MTSTSILFRPYSRLVKIQLLDKQVEVPENNALLRCLQFLAPEPISYGRFCWNEDCQYCRVTYDMADGTKERAALSCKVMAEEGMRVSEGGQSRDFLLPAGFKSKIKAMSFRSAQRRGTLRQAQGRLCCLPAA